MERTACVLVSGRVQAVGYRMYARRCANDLGVTGFAQNLSDGRVKVVASGPEKRIGELLEKLRRGPRFAAVRNVEIRWLDNYTSFSRFDIK